ncbi:hypothetical protein G5V58_01030 [Nocardioides anomalus]|uniref:Outer membrane channel protein CpnT-like N-terminal domain-containing protein n=1 Tax=Nocardioides anomalus TaxID=2712223 RepID=A0A6G6W921_9ACTN|nr:hypothetical protein [Nocardioides anomalus]QIG41540.1 hypothetical protein G5V58_01030 [Nocardioides anomalus]
MIAVESRSYVDGAEAFERANQDAARTHDTLVARLARTGGMAGDSSASAPFASAYDAAAAAALAALVGLVDGFAACGRLAATSLDNHGRAESHAVLSGRTVWTGAHCVSGPVAVLPASLPSVLGADSSSFPDWAAWILDHVEGFVWPDASVPTLRSAASAWRAAALSVDDHALYCATAATALDRLRAPEVPAALAVTHAMARRCRTVADSCRDLAQACDDYATHVERQREEILDLVHDLIRDTLVIEGAGLLLGLATAGLATAGATAANAARIAAAAPRFLRILETLRELAVTAAAPLRAATSTLGEVTRELAVFRNARLTLVSTYKAERVARVERLRALVRQPELLDAQDLRGLSKADVRALCEGWPVAPTSEGVGVKYLDEAHRGRQIRVMDGYPPGSRPDPLTTGPYAVISNGTSRPIKVPLAGNPVL